MRLPITSKPTLVSKRTRSLLCGRANDDRGYKEGKGSHCEDGEAQVPWDRVVPHLTQSSHQDDGGCGRQCCVK